MFTETSKPLSIPVQIFGGKFGPKFRTSLRKLGVIHMYKRDGKVYTFDIPFKLKISHNGDQIIVVMDKSTFPRRYPPQHLVESKKFLEECVGMPLQILDTTDVLAICCQVPGSGLATIGV